MNRCSVVAKFIAGQRWISDTEAELGLGIVIEVSSRQVEISFPAAGERRTYSISSAPISRVRYQPDERIADQDGNHYTVMDVMEEAGCLVYECLTLEGAEQSVHELELDSFVEFSTPKSRLFSGQIDKASHFNLRCQTLSLHHAHRTSSAYGLQGGRVQLLPHQLYIASEVASRFAPRVLLADEVGLGKTIEAGLILHQQLVSGRCQRALIVVPDSLVHQWLVEMLRRFNLAFTVLDSERCQALEESGETNPFESAQLVLCSLSFLADHPERQQQACDANWDLLLVDEAHHLEWSENNVSAEYACIEALAATAKGLLLLTATPEQLGRASHFARLRLLDPDRYHDLAAFLAEEDDYRSLNQFLETLSEHHEADASLPTDTVARLQHYLGETVAQALVDQWQSGESAQALQAASEQLLDRHGTGRVLFRNTRHSVKGFPARQLQSHPLAAPDAYQQQCATGRISVEAQLQPEILLGDDWWLHDSRVVWLETLLREQRADKFLVICAEASTAQALEEYLRLRGVASAVFHEGLSLVNRDRAAAYFADDEDGAQVLICSEIGSEGRNFQFAHHLVLLDLPLNPDLLEQRIGRLDRIGQQHTITIHAPYYQHSAQELLLQWYHRGLNAFERTCAIGQALYQQFQHHLRAVLQHGSDPAPLIEATASAADALLEELNAGRDRLLERNSCKPEVAAKVVEAIDEIDDSYALMLYMERVFDQFGVEHEPHSEHSFVLHPGEHMRIESFPGLNEEGATITYDRDRALSRDDMQFLTWEHPMVTGAQELISASEYGNTAVCTVKLPPLKPGTLLVEAIYVLRTRAPQWLGLYRYLPHSYLRLLVDAEGRQLQEALPADKFTPLLKKTSRATGQELVRHGREPMAVLIESTETLADSAYAPHIEQAKDVIKQDIGAEIERLKALAEVNPNIRQEEIEYLQQRLDLTLSYLQKATVELDAVRIIMAT